MILTFGGGKGGIGKSVIAANMAIALALSGKKVVIMDADLGAANLHAILGIKSPPIGLKDFIFNGYPLKALLMDSGVKNLKFISGAGDVPGISNIPYRVKLKLIKNIKELKADYIIIDLAPGISYNTIDFFNISDNGIIITTPEVTSVLSVFSYMKGALHRRIINIFKGNGEAMEVIETAKGPYNIADLKDRLSRLNGSYVEMVDSVLKRFRPMLIVNRLRKSADADIGESIVRLVKKNLCIEIKNLGHIVESEAVKKSVEDMKPFFIGEQDDKASVCVKEITSSIGN
jgi:flagellar biosynthesis protein FlhG